MCIYRILEQFLVRWLRGCVSGGNGPVRVIYKSAIAGSSNFVLDSPDFTATRDEKDVLELHILSPAFFSRFMYYSHAIEGLEREGIAADSLSRTVFISGPQNLIRLFPKPAVSHPHASGLKGLNYLDQVRWFLLKRLRCRPSRTSYGLEKDDSSIVNLKGIRYLPLSPLDLFVLRHDNSAHVYRRTLILLFLAEQFCFGTTTVACCMDVSMRFGLTIHGLGILLQDMNSGPETGFDSYKLKKLVFWNCPYSIHASLEFGQKALD